MWTRRDFLKASAVAGAAMTLSRWEKPAGAASIPRRPRRLVQIRLTGGIDGILSTDPKTRRDVLPEIDLPYDDTAILESKGFRLGPLCHWLEPYLHKTAIINGVICSTVAHATGTRQVRQMRRVYPIGSPGMSSVLGELIRGDAPFADATNEPDETLPPSRQLIMSPELLRQLALLGASEQPRARLRQAVHELRGRPGAGCVQLESVDALLNRLPSTGLPEPAKLTVRSEYAGLNPQQPHRYSEIWAAAYAELFRDILFVLENDLATVVFVNSAGEWDSHATNLRIQFLNMAAFEAGLSYFLAELEKRTTPDGIPLSEQTGLVLCSELGRFPCVNEFAGKDHFPEVPVIFIGPGIRSGQYGETDKRMMSTPISRETGRAMSSARDRQPTLDDVGATVFHWFGINDPAPYGFLGQRLGFVLDA